MVQDMTASSSPKVTVLMPVFNGVPFLSEAISSILRQTFEDFEFLIIDDGSTDGSGRIIESFDDTRIRFVKNEVNLGLVAALNCGMQLARGEYIARMDADDISRPHRIARQVRFLETSPKVGVCGSWVKFFPKERHYIWKLPATSEEIKCRMFHAVGLAHPSVMLRRKLFLDHGLFYDPAYTHIEDYELWGRALQFMDFANIKEVLLDYRISPDQVCSRHRAEQLAAVAPLRLQRVRELGVEPTADQQKLHEAIMNGSLPPDEKILDSAELWLLHLDKANREAGIYSAHLFTRRLLDIWFEICCISADAGVCTWQRYKGSLLLAAAPHSVRQQIRSIGGWLKCYWRRKGAAVSAR